MSSVIDAQLTYNLPNDRLLNDFSGLQRKIATSGTITDPVLGEMMSSSIVGRKKLASTIRAKWLQTHRRFH
jgi:hypothetical protein